MDQRTSASECAAASGRHNATPAGHVRLTDPQSKASVDICTSFRTAGITVQHVKVDTQQGFTVGWQGRPYYIALHDLENSECEIFADERPIARERDLRGRLAFVPPNCQTGGWMVPNHGPQSFTALFLDPADLEEELASRLEKLPQYARVYFFDESLRSTLGKLRDSLAADVPADRMYVESLCLLAAVELSRLSTPSEQEPGLLGDQVTGRVIDYIMQNLSEDIGLEQLAGVANLSRFHFARAFKRTTRETPYQHLLRRRIERAQQLLRADRLTVAEIAIAVGFKSASRLAAAFRRATDSTPIEFRALSRR